MMRTIEWISGQPSGVPGKIRLVDQTRLPGSVEWIETTDLDVMIDAIYTLKVRGAPAIGIAAAMALAADVQEVGPLPPQLLQKRIVETSQKLAASRPTAVNLFWALDRMQKVVANDMGLPHRELAERLVQEAKTIRDEDAAMCRAIGQHGVRLMKPGMSVLTHCNAGGLATAEFGTALAPIYTAFEQGLTPHVFVDETRPLLQGARLTAWELMQEGIDCTLICDNMAASVMKQGKIDAVFVGADRIAGNGDAANKIGTYSLAVLAQAHRIPFYVCAPYSTVDESLESGDQIPIEERAAEEVTEGFGKRTAPEGVHVYSPAFDVTPASLITAIVCEQGVLQPPYKDSLACCHK